MTQNWAKEQVIEEILRLAAVGNAKKLATTARQAYLDGLLTLQEIESYVKEAKRGRAEK